MKININKSRLSAAVILSAIALSSPGQSQEAVRGRATILPCCLCVGGDATTINLSTGAAPWTVTAPSGPSGQGTVNASNVAWTTTVIPSAQWISPVGNPTTIGDFKYDVSFDARKCIVPSVIVISGKFLADNKGKVLVDGIPIGVSSLGTPNYGFLPGSLTPFSYTIPAGSSSGIHTVSLVATNRGDATGIIVELSVTRKCKGNPKTGELGQGPRDD